MNAEPGSTWAEVIRQTQIKDRMELIWKRPIIVWFSERKKAICRLIKLPGACGDDNWMVQGRDDEQGQDLDVTVAPTTLDRALRYLTPKNGWVIYEFKNEVDFYIEALRYLQK